MKARIDTDCGTFEIELATDAAPVTASYFKKLIETGALDGSGFFRIVGPDNASHRADCPIEVIQGGLRETDPQPIPPVAHESTQDTGLVHRKGTLSAARFGPGETYSSFFICMRDEPALDFGGDRHTDGLGFAAFGEVTDGFDAVEAIFARREAEEYMQAPVLIRSCRLIPA